MSRCSCEVLEKYNLCYFSISSLVEQNHTIFRAERYTTMHVCAQLLSCVQLLATPWTVAHQAPLSLEFSRQEFWSGVPFPPLGDLPNPGIKPTSLIFPYWQADSLPLPTWEALIKSDMIGKYILPFSKLLFLFLYDGFLRYAEVFQFSLVPFVYFCFCFPCL